MKNRVLVLTLVFVCIFSFCYVVAEDVTINLETNLTGLRVINGKWLSVDKGVYGDNDGVGNCFIMSDVKMEKGVEFTYSADISIENIAGGIVFGVENPDKPEDVWYCMNIDAGNKDAVLVRLFKVTRGNLDWTVNIVKSDYEANKSYSFKVDVLEDGTMEFYVDGEHVGAQYDTGYEGGYLGIVTCVSKVTFKNLKYEVIEKTPTPEKTPSPTPTTEPIVTETKIPNVTNTLKPTVEDDSDDVKFSLEIWISFFVILALVIGIIVVLIIKKKIKK